MSVLRWPGDTYPPNFVLDKILSRFRLYSVTAKYTCRIEQRDKGQKRPHKEQAPEHKEHTQKGIHAHVQQGKV